MEFLVMVRGGQAPQTISSTATTGVASLLGGPQGGPAGVVGAMAFGGPAKGPAGQPNVLVSLKVVVLEEVETCRLCHVLHCYTIAQ